MRAVLMRKYACRYMGSYGYFSTSFETDWSFGFAGSEFKFQ
jgi:hypothetical protein